MFENSKCEYCGELFAKNDDIVVCPDCGAPYHRACWLEHGTCAHAAQHGSGFRYTRVQQGDLHAENVQEQETPEDEDFIQKVKEELFGGNSEKRVCENCGAPLVDGGEYCPRCAHKQGDPVPRAGQIPLQNSLPEGMAQTIDGEKVADLALLVRNNAPKLLPRMQKVSERKVKVGWSWLSFFFGYLYFFFRKMYKYGIIVILAQALLFHGLNIALGDPITAVNNTISEVYSASVSTDTPSQAEYIKVLESAAKELIKTGAIQKVYLLLGISWAVSNIACALLFDYLYLLHCKNTIGRMRKSAEILGEMSDSDFRMNLYARGGVSLFGLVLGYFLNMTLSQGVVYIIDFFSDLFGK